jgi:hypothetical protein
MSKKYRDFCGRVMVGIGLVATLAFLNVTWSSGSQFRNECYLAAGEWRSHKVDNVLIVPPAQKPTKTSKASVGSGKLGEDDFLVAVDKSGKPIFKPEIAAVTKVQPPGAAEPFMVSTRIEQNLERFRHDRDEVTEMSLFVGISLTLLIVGLVLLSLDYLSSPVILPLLFGAAPVIGFALARVNFYLLYIKPWNAFTDVYHFERAAPEIALPMMFVGFVVGGGAASIVWAFMSFAGSEKK